MSILLFWSISDHVRSLPFRLLQAAADLPRHGTLFRNAPHFPREAPFVLPSDAMALYRPATSAACPSWGRSETTLNGGQATQNKDKGG
jgi:hypothetical protein